MKKNKVLISVCLLTRLSLSMEQPSEMSYESLRVCESDSQPIENIKYDIENIFRKYDNFLDIFKKITYLFDHHNLLHFSREATLLRNELVDLIKLHCSQKIEHLGLLSRQNALQKYKEAALAFSDALYGNTISLSSCESPWQGAMKISMNQMIYFILSGVDPNEPFEVILCNRPIKIPMLSFIIMNYASFPQDAQALLLFFIMYGANITDRTYKMALETKNLCILELLIAFGNSEIPHNTKEELFNLAKQQMPTLVRYPALLEMLLDNGLDINIKQELSGNTLLMWAVYLDEVKSIELLLQRGINSDAQNNMGENAYYWAKKNLENAENSPYFLGKPDHARLQKLNKCQQIVNIFAKYQVGKHAKQSQSQSLFNNELNHDKEYFDALQSMPWITIGPAQYFTHNNQVKTPIVNAKAKPLNDDFVQEYILINEANSANNTIALVEEDKIFDDADWDNDLTQHLREDIESINQIQVESELDMASSENFALLEDIEKACAILEQVEIEEKELDEESVIALEKASEDVKILKQLSDGRFKAAL